MAQFRRNHEKQPGQFMFRLLILAIGIIALVFWLYGAMNETPGETVGISPDPVDGMNIAWPLDDLTDQIVQHSSYTLGYNEASEQASWVGYELTREQLNRPRVQRKDWYDEDPEVLTQSAHHRDYSRSGYTRGHLIPAADRGYDRKLMDETFYMSNISPQLRGFNGGVWRDLEEHVRDWARRHRTLYIFTGPVLHQLDGNTIGKTSEVEVPEMFYKVVWAPGVGSIGFLMPNETSTRPLMDFAVSVDDVEAKTGIDFFKDMMPVSSEEKIESSFIERLWPIDQQRFRRRVNEWNRN